MLRNLLNGYSNAHEIFSAHEEHLGDQHKLLIIPLKDEPLLPRKGFHGNSTRCYVLWIFQDARDQININNQYLY